ncbi:hypothetical protein Defa_02550 [Desulfovibrio sp. TH_2024_36128]|uniref:CBS domain-containing protein n=1 Tax=Desulfovibrio falkowii TaxID=3136602 RepID=A0ABQ0E514_9BACT
MDGGSEGHSTIWSRLSRLFGHDDQESLEKAILEARAEGEVEPDEESMLLGILRFNDLQVQDTMIPRTDIDCVPHDMPMAEVAAIIVRSGHSRIPVYKETRDNIVGILHAKDLLRSMLDGEGNVSSLAGLIREPFFVPETKSIRTLLQEFRARKQHIAIALDEYGGTSGLITIEDVLEEIVGDIEDEHDTPREEDIRPVGDNIYELTGRALLEDLEDMGVDLDSDEVDTIGGYLSMEAGHVPAPGESFTLRGWTFTVLEADRKLILRLRMEPADSAASRQTAGQDTAQQDGEQGAGPETAQDAAQDEASDDPAVAPRYETLPGSLGAAATAAAPLDDAAASPQAAVQAAEEILRSTPPPAAETGDDAPRPTESPRV